jgi:hypothetical protein
MKTNLKLFFMGALQIFCITLNTWLISHNYMAQSLVTQFLTTFVWTFNVQRIACSTMIERIAHALGAMAGGAIVWGLTLLF